MKPTPEQLKAMQNLKFLVMKAKIWKRAMQEMKKKEATNLEKNPENLPPTTKN